MSKIRSYRVFSRSKLTEMQGTLLLDIVIRERPSVFKLLSSKDKALLVGRNALLVLNLRLDIIDGVGRLDLEGNGFSSKSLHENLHVCASNKFSLASFIIGF